MGEGFRASAVGNRAQTTLALKVLAGLIGLAALIIPISALGLRLPSPGRFAFLGLMAGIAALASGAAVGLLFGLPTTRAAPTSSDEDHGSAGWYVDSTSLEQIADWLVKIIVGVTLTQFDGLATRFTRAAEALTRGMVCPAQTSCGAETGGFLLAAFFLLGFLASYLWMRRYFMGELAEGRVEAIRRGQAMLADAAMAGTIQDKPGRVDAGRVREMAFQAAESATRLAEVSVAPGDHENDPWKGAFDGLPRRNGVSVSARVEPLEHQPKLFGVELRVEVEDHARRADYEGQYAALYLHPTFREPVQYVRIRHGRAQLQLVAYGAFTVGVLMPDGLKLELDLAELEQAPRAFREL